MKSSWFKRKVDSWVWYPCAWQGWICCAAFLFLVVADFIRLDSHSHSVSDTVRPWIIDVLILGGILVFVSWIKGKKPRSS